MKRQKSGKILSMGFGFAEFDTAETARAVCKQLQVKEKDNIVSLLSMEMLCSTVIVTLLGIWNSGNSFGWACTYFAIESCKRPGTC